MSRRLLALASALAALLAAAVLVPTARGAVGTGTFSRHTFSAPGLPSRDYWLYVPRSLPAGPVPLVVYLHGCTQTAPDAAIGTRWNELADRRGFVVVYPEQKVAANSSAPLADGNGAGCWNWFLPDHQSRDAGEPGSIAGITRSVMTTMAIDPARVYVLGASAGADMSVILGATYPDLYAAIGVMAGCAYRTCTDVDGSAAYAAMGPRARSMPAIVVQGTADALNVYPLGVGAAHQWLGTDDLADDGQANGSVSQQPASTETVGFPPEMGAPGSGDACIRNHQFPCAGGALGIQGSYPYTVDHFTDRSGRPLVDLWSVHGLAHGYPGGDPAGTFTDPLGPDVTTAAYDFFLDHPR